jgi:ADP-ribose pyrophosphatase YjhB (NUDIX family)
MNMNEDKPHRLNIGIFAIIFDDKKRILCCHRTDLDLWNLPGGALEKGEAPWEGVKREATEETGLDIEVERLAGIYYTPRQNQIAFSFICSIVGGKLNVNEESDAFKYFVYAEIPENFSPKHRARIKDALENSNKLIMKVQNGPSVRELIEEGKL